MPWQEVGTMELRMQAVREVLRGRASVDAVATAHGVSRKTVYKWVGRFVAEGETGLVDRSRRPVSHPRTVAADVLDALVAARARFPYWSAGKLLRWLVEREPTRGWPSRTSAYTWLRRRAHAAAQRRPPSTRVVARPPVALHAGAEANDLWTTDFKGRFRTHDRRYCHPLTVRDGFSRFALCCHGLPAESAAGTRQCFERLFRTYGLPRRLRMDNGRPFAGPGLGGLTTLSAWWLRLGIALEHIAPGHPEQNGSHEQFHRVLKRHTACPPAATAAAQQRRFDAFCLEYNTERPHDALDGAAPARYYAPSPRPYPRRLPPLAYPGHYQVHRVRHQGVTRWQGRDLFVSKALRGEWIGFEEIDDGRWAVWYGPARLATFDTRGWAWA